LENCPVLLAGQHKGKENDTTLILTAMMIADPDPYIWYSFFGGKAPGSLNDINFLNKSSIVTLILNGLFNLQTRAYTINGIACD
jgi:hypothetical protein